MRKSVKIKERTVSLIEKIREERYSKNNRVYDGYIVNEALSCITKDELEQMLSKKESERSYKSTKFNFRREGLDILEALMNEENITADMIIYAALENHYEELMRQKRFKRFKDRQDILAQEGMEVYISGDKIDLKHYLPAIYSVSVLGTKKEQKPITIYVGKSKLFMDRGTKHVVSLYDDPGYFGLSYDDFKNPGLKIKFEMEYFIDISKCNSVKELDLALSEKEREVNKSLDPILQTGMNMKSKKEKKKIMRELISEIITV